MRYHRLCSLSVVDTGKAFTAVKVFEDVLKLNSKVNHNPEVKFSRTVHNAFHYTWLLVQDLSLGPFLFLIYMNNIPKVINNKYIPVLFANYTSISFSHSNFKGFKENMNTVFETLNNWFERNILSLKFEETHYTHFVTENNTPIYIQICYDNTIIPIITYTEFLGLIIDNTLN